MLARVFLHLSQWLGLLKDRPQNRTEKLGKVLLGRNYSC